MVRRAVICAKAEGRWKLWTRGKRTALVLYHFSYGRLLALPQWPPRPRNILRAGVQGSRQNNSRRGATSINLSQQMYHCSRVPEILARISQIQQRAVALTVAGTQTSDCNQEDIGQRDKEYNTTYASKIIVTFHMRIRHEKGHAYK